MSAKELSTLQAHVEAKPGLESTIAAGMDKSGTPHIPEELSILPVRGIVVFPGTIIPLNIQRAASLKLLDDTLPRTKVIGLLTQRDEAKEDPTPQDLYSVGTAALVLKLVRQAEDNVLVIVQGLRRFSLRKIIETSPFLRAEVDLPESILPPASKEWEATFRNLRDSAARLFELAPDAPEQARLMILNIENPEQSVTLLGVRLLDFHIGWQRHLPYERAVIDLHGQQLQGASLVISRLRQLSRAANHHPSRFDGQINERAIDPRQIDANTNGFFAAIRIDCRFPGVRCKSGKLQTR